MHPHAVPGTRPQRIRRATRKPMSLKRRVRRIEKQHSTEKAALEVAFIETNRVRLGKSELSREEYERRKEERPGFYIEIHPPTP